MIDDAVVKLPFPIESVKEITPTELPQFVFKETKLKRNMQIKALNASSLLPFTRESYDFGKENRSEGQGIEWSLTHSLIHRYTI